MKRSIIFFLLLLFSACSHPRDNVPYPRSRPNMNPAPTESLIIKKENEKRKPTKPTKQTSLIVIDAGHGGDDFGTKSHSKPKYHEKSLNLATALLLNGYLQKMGYQTKMTRSTDEFISLQRRVDIANENQADLFVSVHYNSAPAKEADGIEVFYYKSDDDKTRSTESRRLATSVISQVTKMTEAKSRGVKHGNYAVIRETKMPAILVEGGFLTNEEEMEKIKDPAYIKTIAWGIAKGIQNHLTKSDK